MRHALCFVGGGGGRNMREVPIIYGRQAPQIALSTYMVRKYWGTVLLHTV